MTISTVIKVSTATIGFLSIFGLVNSANAAIINGNFNNELSSWNTSGDVSISNGQALLTTASSVFEDDFPIAGTPFNFSGNDVTYIADLETFLGVAPFTLDPTNSFFGAFEGSAIKQTFTANAGDILAFDWNFFTNENDSFVANDTTYLTLVNTIDSSYSVITLANINSNLSPSSSSLRFKKETGTNSFSTKLTTGEYILGLNVIDDTDSTVSSALLVDNIRITTDSKPPTSVPEPASILGLIAVGGLGFLQKKSS
ncbi:MAG: PEP-CTERM sorting domain-containing protein [Xenococcaceae cyanobacterium MO_188.B32]|nr:PEP-CTERM sorting domain-containing protein [Xenococcaceae cyanobacterium MO_188.B32]